MSAILVPALIFAFSALLLLLPSVTGPRERIDPSLLAIGAFVAIGVASTDPTVAAAALALSGVVHALRLRGVSRDGVLLFGLSSLLVGGVAVALAVEAHEVAFGCSVLAITLRGGAMPAHLLVSSLLDRAPAEQIRQLGSLLPLVFLHLRFVDHHPIALTAAAPIVVFGAASALLAAWITLAADDPRALLRGSTLTHGSILVAAIGAAGTGNYGAALFAAITLGLALGGLGAVTAALEDRAGPILPRDAGGRAAAFPLLASAWLTFGLAGVAAPGTAGFIADDLLLHAIAQVSVPAVVMLVLASAVLAISSLRVFSRVFLGKPVPSAAADLAPRERWGVATVVLVLLVLGWFPRLLTGPANELLDDTSAVDAR